MMRKPQEEDLGLKSAERWSQGWLVCRITPEPQRPREGL